MPGAVFRPPREPGWSRAPVGICSLPPFPEQVFPSERASIPGPRTPGSAPELPAPQRLTPSAWETPAPDQTPTHLPARFGTRPGAIIWGPPSAGTQPLLLQTPVAVATPVSPLLMGGGCQLHPIWPSNGETEAQEQHKGGPVVPGLLQPLRATATEVVPPPHLQEGTKGDPPHSHTHGLGWGSSVGSGRGRTLWRWDTPARDNGQGGPSCVPAATPPAGQD